MCPPVRDCLRNVYLSNYKRGDILLAGRRLTAAALPTGLDHRDNRQRYLLAVTFGVMRHAGAKTGERAELYTEDEENAFGIAMAHAG